MTQEEIDALTDVQVYAQAADIARGLGGEYSVRMIRMMLPEQVRMFLLANGG